MTRWFEEYNFFTQKQFDEFLQQHGIQDIKAVKSDDAIWKQIEEHLQQVENAWSNTLEKTQSTVRLLLPEIETPNLATVLQGGNSELEAEHDYIQNEHHIPCSLTSVDAHPFDLILAMRHEAEHGAQDFGAGYSKSEGTLIWIERACSHATEDYYWVRLSEMNARMKEAEWCTEMMTTHKSHTSIEDKAAILQMAKGLLPKLWDIRLAEQLVPINTAQQKAIKKKDVDTDLLQRAFPDIKERDLYHKAIKFLSTEASKIYREHFFRLKTVSEQFEKDIQKWEQELQAELKQHKQKQENQTIEACAQQYGIPVLTSMPKGAISIPLQTTYVAETLQNLTDKHYSPAIVIFSNKEAQLVYDIAPVPRSYSTLPSLRMQWQMENEASNENPVDPIEYHGHDDRFD